MRLADLKNDVLVGCSHVKLLAECKQVLSKTVVTDSSAALLCCGKGELEVKCPFSGHSGWSVIHMRAMSQYGGVDARCTRCLLYDC